MFYITQHNLLLFISVDRLLCKLSALLLVYPIMGLIFFIIIVFQVMALHV